MKNLQFKSNLSVNHFLENQIIVYIYGNLGFEKDQKINNGGELKVGKLVLAGGGDEEQTLSIDIEFMRMINKDKPMLYIPIAMDTDSIPYESCFSWVNGVFNPLGIDRITMWTEEDLRDKNSKDLSPFSAIYIGGGNTFSLLKEFKETNFRDTLKEFLENGGIVYGGSAGAIIFGEDIGTCFHMDSNDVMLRELDGLGLAKDHSIWCHYNTDNDGLIASCVSHNHVPVIALPEETALLIDEEGIMVIGTEPAYVFEGEAKKMVAPGQRLF